MFFHGKRWARIAGPLWIGSYVGPLSMVLKNGVSLGLFHPEFQDPTYSCFLGPPYGGVAYIVYHHVTLLNCDQVPLLKGHFSLWWNVWRTLENLSVHLWNLASGTQKMKVWIRIWFLFNFVMFSLPSDVFWGCSTCKLMLGETIPFWEMQIKVHHDQPASWGKKTFKCWWKVEGIPPPKMPVKPTLQV